jgi:hypothetical protein
VNGINVHLGRNVILARDGLLQDGPSSPSPTRMILLDSFVAKVTTELIARRLVASTGA